MNAGKSLALLQVAHNYEEQGRQVLLYTAAVDDRYGQGKISSRLGISRDAAVFDSSTNFEVRVADAHPRPACVLVDEAQFLSRNQVQQLHRLSHRLSVPVIAFGIRTDFRGEPFEGSAWLLSLADSHTEIKQICRCGSKATMNLRVDDAGRSVGEGPQTLIGGNSRYQQVCPSCFYDRTWGSS